MNDDQIFSTGDNDISGLAARPSPKKLVPKIEHYLNKKKLILGHRRQCPINFAPATVCVIVHCTHFVVQFIINYVFHP